MESCGTPHIYKYDTESEEELEGKETIPSATVKNTINHTVILYIIKTTTVEEPPFPIPSRNRLWES